jgi:hypothetical protein
LLRRRVSRSTRPRIRNAPRVVKLHVDFQAAPVAFVKLLIALRNYNAILIRFNYRLHNLIA